MCSACAEVGGHGSLPLLLSRAFLTPTHPGAQYRRDRHEHEEQPDDEQCYAQTLLGADRENYNADEHQHRGQKEPQPITRSPRLSSRHRASRLRHMRLLTSLSRVTALIVRSP